MSFTQTQFKNFISSLAERPVKLVGDRARARQVHRRNPERRIPGLRP